MSKTTRQGGQDLRAAGKLAVVATQAITDVVEEMHRTISPPMGALAGVVYGSIRGVTQLVGDGLDAALAQLGSAFGESVPGPERDAVLAALNGVFGDYLSETKSPLAIDMTLRHAGEVLPLEVEGLREQVPDASAKLLILIHGSAMNDRQWNRLGHDHGIRLAAKLGYTPLYLRYNSGLHISTNGRTLAALLERLSEVWPLPVQEISMIGHSMGGLVARSACVIGGREQLRWRSKLRRLVCLGSPHHGSPLERGGSLIHAVLGASAYSAPIGRLAQARSAGITDLRFGYILDEHWEGRDRFSRTADARRDLALPEGVECYAVAATTATVQAEKLPGDGLVPVDSALGRHVRAELTLAFPETHQFIALGTSHLDLLSRAEVYAQLESWFEQGQPAQNISGSNR